ncbi:DUF3747 domain-containing protein [Thermosynechococcaceae cyanobacterium BACA0444]|uniref:DUF3747 domain-containing protein n=1 Tax=Pseudocalidococcus azoricus BACA0444 TaxID=2918990 RepID=A0AAE4JVV0_9CYAN|nr:DUF3747 domain-containing protein [Pseudocalidococcus azoricus]MDS3859453.1 DUF3747 domain-containing protein [Pseudocalidococcus azoricus BACA0444]
MLKHRLHSLGLLTLTCLGLGFGSGPAWGSQFGQKDVDQTKYAVIAMPIARGGYKLLVVEQVSNKRPCWAENGLQPTVIDPLLATFDFTGICGRSMDSNGYSIRVEQQDLGMEYRLSVEQQENELYLVGVRNRGGAEAKMVIGRTNGLVPGAFLKINLEPNWRITRRTFEERTLGHVYFTSDSMQAAFTPAAIQANPAPPATPVVSQTDAPTSPNTPTVPKPQAPQPITN